jgi:hypothetical protein
MVLDIERNVEADTVKHFKDAAIHAQDVLHDTIDLRCACDAFCHDVERFALDGRPHAVE